MRVGISESDANDTVATLIKWAQWLVAVITTLRNFLINIGLLEGEIQPVEPIE